MQSSYYLLAIVSFIVLISGCSLAKDTPDENVTDRTEDVDEVIAEQEPETETTENKEAKDDTNYRLDIGNIEIWIDGEATIEEDKVIIARVSNLLVGARITFTAVISG